ncbi:TonB-dependent receptor [Massilia sp.]|uniref:TonB-dependent receptor n=1 Tax=Massilia sp. TaxID=1882437 RepID=UPI00289DD478|nr:TonB-dependent receptor [Massilia sp.]
MTHFVKRGLLAGSCAVSMIGGAACAAPSPEAVDQQASAATPEAAAPMAQVVVTAQRREQALQDVPAAVTALGAAELANKQIVDVKALSANAPSLLIVDTPVGKNNMIIGMRGIAPTSIFSNNDPTVGIYVNGVYYARTAGANAALVDMESVEVIRGPQGTLFGRNTIGGALNMTTKAPKQQFEGSVRVGAGNFDQRSLGGVLNVPLGDKVAARIVVDALRHDGYGRSATLGQQLGDEDRRYVRASLRARPTRDLLLDLTWDRFRSDASSQVWIVNYFDPSIAAASLAPIAQYLQTGGYTSYAGFNPANTTDVDNSTATLRWNAGPATLKSISAYRHLDTVSGYDLDATPQFVNQLRYGVRGHQFTQELQVYGSALSDRLDWIAGAYYFTESLRDSSLATSPSGAATLGRLNEFDSTQTSASLFGQLTYAVLPNLRATAGARLVKDKRDVDYYAPRYISETGALLAGAGGCALAAAGLDQGGCRYAPPTLRSDYTPWTLGLDYKLEDGTLVYGKVSRGFRSGGFQPAGGTSRFAYAPFDKEQVVSYEAGSKMELFQRRLRLNAAAYLAKYGDIQQIAPHLPPGSSTTVSSVINAGDATVKGLEVDAQLRLGQLNLTVGVGLTDPEFDNGPFEGLSFITTAERTWSLGADYPLATPFGRLDLHLDYNWRSDVMFFQPVSTNALPFRPLTAGQVRSNTQAGYGLLNAMFTLNLPGTKTTVSLWGKNLGGKYYWARSNSFFLQGYNNQTPGDPRTFGINVDYRF